MASTKTTTPDVAARPWLVTISYRCTACGCELHGDGTTCLCLDCELALYPHGPVAELARTRVTPLPTRVLAASAP